MRRLVSGPCDKRGPSGGSGKREAHLFLLFHHLGPPAAARRTLAGPPPPEAELRQREENDCSRQRARHQRALFRCLVNP